MLFKAFVFLEVCAIRGFLSFVELGLIGSFTFVGLEKYPPAFLLFCRFISNEAVLLILFSSFRNSCLELSMPFIPRFVGSTTPSWPPSTGRFKILLLPIPPG